MAKPNRTNPRRVDQLADGIVATLKLPETYELTNNHDRAIKARERHAKLIARLGLDTTVLRKRALFNLKLAPLHIQLINRYLISTDLGIGLPTEML